MMNMILNLYRRKQQIELLVYLSCVASSVKPNNLKVETHRRMRLRRLLSRCSSRTRIKNNTAEERKKALT
jgi:hypothetical protein